MMELRGARTATGCRFAIVVSGFNADITEGLLRGAQQALAGELAAKAPVAMQYIIEAVNKGLEVSFDKGQFLEATLFGLVASTDDMREGTKAFLEKRKPEFKGR